MTLAVADMLIRYDILRLPARARGVLLWFAPRAQDYDLEFIHACAVRMTLLLYLHTFNYEHIIVGKFVLNR